jgi:hypothetical protein
LFALNSTSTASSSQSYNLILSIINSNNQSKMQLISTIAAGLAVAGAAVASPIAARQANCPVPSTFQLEANLPDTAPYNSILYTNLIYANNSLFIGNIKYETYSEPFIVSPQGSFLSQHQAPTGWQYTYVYPSESAPVGLTIAHAGGSPPAGASTEGFNFNINGNWAINGTRNWLACAVEKDDAGNWETAQIHWLGSPNGSGECTPISLTGVPYGFPEDSN